MGCTGCAAGGGNRGNSGGDGYGNNHRGMITVLEFTVAVADTQYSIALPPNVLGLWIDNRSAAGLRFAFLSGVVADPTASALDNFEVGPGGKKSLGEFEPGSGATLYYASTMRGAKFVLMMETGSP